MNPEPGPANAYRADLAEPILRSHRHWTGRDLIEPTQPEAARALYHAPFAVLAHDASADPLFTYANLTAQHLFEMPWAEIVGLPSRQSAEPMRQTERERLLARVAQQGYIDDYNGVRIAKSGRRFEIRHVLIWNLIDADGHPAGQAAAFGEWLEIAP